MLEFEKKIRLTAREYQALREKWREKSPVLQTNYYYDTPDWAMYQEGVTCRIRKKDGEYTATIKTHHRGEAGCSTEQSEKVRSEIIRGENAANLFAGKGLTLQGSLQTERLSVSRYPGVRLDLDKNTYLGATDYELEVEYTPESTPLCTLTLNWLSEFLGYPLYTPAHQEFLLRAHEAKPKSQRFFERKKQLEEENEPAARRSLL